MSFPAVGKFWMRFTWEEFCADALQKDAVSPLGLEGGCMQKYPT